MVVIIVPGVRHCSTAVQQRSPLKPAHLKPKMLFKCVLISGAIIHFLLSRNYEPFFLATIFYKSSILSAFKFCDRFIISESRAFNFIKKSNKSFFERKLSIFDNHHKFGSEKNTQRNII